MPRTLTFECEDGVLIVAHNELPPDDAEFTGYVDAILEAPELRGVLIVTHPDNPGPSSVQRKSSADALGAREVFAAVMTDTGLHRVLLRAYRWFLGGKMDAFGIDDWTGALEFLGVPAADHAGVRARAQRMLRSVQSTA